MKLTRGQKIYGGVFAVAIAALAVDRLALGRSPEQALGSESLLIAPAPSASKPPEVRPSDAGDTTGPGAIARMLESLRREHDIQPEQARNAFSASWIKVPEEQRPANRNGPNVEAFIGHKLTSVMAGGRNRASVMIDGRILHLGQALDGFKLIGVDKQSALFESQGTRVRLTMGGEAQVIR